MRQRLRQRVRKRAGRWQLQQAGSMHRAEDDQSFKNLNNIYVCQSAGKAKTVTADVGVEVGGAAAAAATASTAATLCRRES